MKHVKTYISGWFLVRLSRMLRALKIIKVVRAFDSLYLLIRSIQASVGALIWSFVLLIFIQIASGMVLAQLLSNKNAAAAAADLFKKIIKVFFKCKKGPKSVFLLAFVGICCFSLF